MEQLRSLSALIDRAKEIAAEGGPKRVSVAKPDEPGFLTAIEEARSSGLAAFTLVGDPAGIEEAAKKAGADLANYRVVPACGSELATALAAVREVSGGNADIYMKGNLHSSEFLRSMLDKEAGLRRGKNTISHCSFFHVEGLDRFLFLSDGAFNMYPDLKQKADIVQNAVDFARAFGVHEPKVACLAAVETVNPDMPATLDAAALAVMNRRGQIRGCIVDGPLAMDNAISEEAARIKRIDSPVAGKADVLIVPEIEAGNIMAKSITYLTKNENAGLIVGAAAPIVLTSRADTPRVKLLSIAAAVVMSSFAGKLI